MGGRGRIPDGSGKRGLGARRNSAPSRSPVACRRAVDGEAVGGIALMLQEDVDRCSAEVGYWLSEKYWGRGIVTSALNAITNYAFKHLDVTRVFAIPFAHNAASIRVLEKAGYRCEGRMRRSAIKDGVVLDQFLYAKTDEDQ